MPDSHVQDEPDHESHDHEGHDHDHEGHDDDQHDHDHDGHEHHDHDHLLIKDRLPEGDWVVDPQTSDVHFSTRALLGIVPVSGLFESFTGSFHVDASGVATGELKIDTVTVDTGTAKRDDHLRTEDFFNSALHPHMTFNVESLSPCGEDHLEITGLLQIREVTIPLAFTVYAVAHGDHLHIEGRATIDHKAAGLGWAKPGMVGRKVKAQVALTLQRA